MAAISGAERREAIIQILNQADGPVSATVLAGQFQVSRQIVVGDIALLRAGGEDISATPRGYRINRRQTGVTHLVACSHAPEDMERELTAIVDAGGEVADVVVEHPVYGQLTGMLGVRSRYDVAQFIHKVRAHEAHPLSALTDGVHLHTVRCPDEATFQRVVEALRREGFLFQLP